MAAAEAPVPSVLPYVAWSSLTIAAVPADAWPQVFGSMQALKGHVQEYPGCQKLEAFVHAEAEGAVCAEHPNEPATGRCVTCGKLVCEACGGVVSNRGVYCIDHTPAVTTSASGRAKLSTCSNTMLVVTTSKDASGYGNAS